MNATELRPRLRADQPNPHGRLRNRPVIERLMFRTALLDDGCWEWRGSKNPRGYGHIRKDDGGSLYAVHRVSYEHFLGPIPKGLEVDHTCFNRACVNPDHLEAVTHQQNVNRGRHNQNDGKSACLRGHDFTPENTSINTNGKRVCKTCARERMRDYRAARRTA